MYYYDVPTFWVLHKPHAITYGEQQAQRSSKQYMQGSPADALVNVQRCSTHKHSLCAFV